MAESNSDVWLTKPSGSGAFLDFICNLGDGNWNKNVFFWQNITTKV